MIDICQKNYRIFQKQAFSWTSSKFTKTKIFVEILSLNRYHKAIGIKLNYPTKNKFVKFFRKMILNKVVRNAFSDWPKPEDLKPFILWPHPDTFEIFVAQ